MVRLEQKRTNEYMSNEYIESLIAKEQERQQNSIITGIYGLDDTGKTGMAFDLLTQGDIDAGRKLYVLDFDKGAIPIWKEHWNKTPNIIIVNPTAYHEEGDRRGEQDATKTILKTVGFLQWLKDTKAIDEVAGVILDGLDVLLKTCEWHMREDALNIGVTDRVQRTDWGIRDRKYNQCVDIAKSLPFPTIFITHLKDKKAYVDKELQVVGKKIDWGEFTTSQMYQRVLCMKQEDVTGIKWKAVIEKSKGTGSLTGKEFILAEKAPNEKIKWNGFDWSVFK